MILRALPIRGELPKSQVTVSPLAITVKAACYRFCYPIPWDDEELDGTRPWQRVQ
jgi:hypothetical protein